MSNLTALCAAVFSLSAKNLRGGGGYPPSPPAVRGLTDCSCAAQVSEAEFAGLPSLDELVLSGNRLRRVGHLLTALPALTRADLSGNSITSVTLLDHQERLPHEAKVSCVCATQPSWERLPHEATVSCVCATQPSWERPP